MRSLQTDQVWLRAVRSLALTGDNNHGTVAGHPGVTASRAPSRRPSSQRHGPLIRRTIHELNINPYRAGRTPTTSHGARSASLHRTPPQSGVTARSALLSRESDVLENGNPSAGTNRNIAAPPLGASSDGSPYRVVLLVRFLRRCSRLQHSSSSRMLSGTGLLPVAHRFTVPTSTPIRKASWRCDRPRRRKARRKAIGLAGTRRGYPALYAWRYVGIMPILGI